MAERHFKAAILRRFKSMKRLDRIAAVRKLASGSAEDEAFVRDTFPDLYREAFLSQRRAAGASPAAWASRNDSLALRPSNSPHSITKVRLRSLPNSPFNISPKISVSEKPAARAARIKRILFAVLILVGQSSHLPTM